MPLLGHQRVERMTPATLGGSAMEGKQDRRRQEAQSTAAGTSQLCKLQGGRQVRHDQTPLRACRGHLSRWGSWCSMGTPPLLRAFPPAIGAPFAWTCQLPTQAFAFARLSLALLPSDTCTVPSTFPSGLWLNTTVSESTPQASCTKDNHHHFLPSHLLYSSPWCIKLFAVSPFRCDRRDPISITALSPVPSQCLAHAEGSINTCWTSRYFNNYKYYIVSTCWPASARWHDSQEQGIYLFFRLFFPP